ncbi:hypothetical protein GCU56_04225 [Geodermatophilus sabuli]|uniref:ABM domain-containing protein n=1 Tax=Geodermatophilus sabuli TaxID=1564158 RepID=A0A7K3VXI9_9ACTN|nr:hypothetical protein [Geodermatophilus sabuli]NEK57078.1 hypothetical protein [Geodermatophilus sabuli]
MYARSTTIHADRQSVDEGITFVRDQVMPMVVQMEGCVGLSMLADHETGHCIVTTSWRDEESMRASAEGVRDSRQRAAEVFRGQPEVQEWEIAVLHRVHATHEGACARLTWLRSEPDRMDGAVDTFRMALMPRLEAYPGFCSTSLLVRRAEGIGVSAVTFSDREAMEGTRETGRAMRDEFSSSTGIAITDVAEFELVIAHLRVPETV